MWKALASHAGVNRSAAIVVAYLMEARATSRGMGAVSAVRKVWQARPIVLTNNNFIRQLAEHELGFDRELAQ